MVYLEIIYFKPSLPPFTEMKSKAQKPFAQDDTEITE